MPIHIHVVSGCFPITAELSSCDLDCLDHKTKSLGKQIKNIFSLAVYRKRLFTPDVESC